MKYLKVLCFTTALSLSISLVPMTFVSAQSLDAVIASNEISHSDEQIEPHLVGEDNRGNLDSVSSSSEDSSGQLDSDDSDGQMSGEETGGSVSSTGQLDSEAGVSGMKSGGSTEQLVIEIQPQEDSVVVSSGLGNGGLSDQVQVTSGQGQTSTGSNSSPMSAEEFSSLLSSSVTPDTTSRLSTTVTSLIKRAASTITTLLCVFITAFLTVRVLLDLMFIALPFTESIATKIGFGAENPTNPQGVPSTSGLNSSLPGGNRMSLPPQYPSLNSSTSTPSSKRQFTLVSEEVLRARQSPHPFKTYCHDAIIILTVTPMLLVLTVSGVFNHLGLLFGDVIVSLLNNLGGIL